MAAIGLLTGTTADYEAVESLLILKEREIAVEIDSNGYFLLRQGDGRSTFFNLPIIVNNRRYEEILAAVQADMITVSTFSANMNSATAAANAAATQANNAAAAANAAAQACEGLVIQQNTMVDTVTGTSCVLSVEDGLLTIREAD